MLFVKLNGVDITEKVELKSIKITEQLGNRANTCTFTVLDHPVPESALIEVWEGSELTQEELSSSSTLHLDEMYEYFQKYRIGEELRIPAGSANAKKVTIQSIDHPGRILTIVGTLGTTYPENTKVGRLIFAGVSQKNPDDEIACGVFVYKVQATDWTKAFDAKNVVDTFEDQYPREIIGRTVHKFTATDKFLEITDAETPGTMKATGVARTLEVSSDGAYKANSVSTGATGAGSVKVLVPAGQTIGVFDGMFEEGGINDKVAIDNRTFEAPMLSSGYIHFSGMSTAQKDEFGWRSGGGAIGGGTGAYLCFNGSAFGQPNSTHSQQALALQDDAWIETDIYINEAGTYTLGWREAYRSYGGANSYFFSVDGTLASGPWTAISTSWTWRYVSLTLTKGWHTFRLSGTAVGDKTTFFDEIQLHKSVSNYNWKSGWDYFCSIAKRGVNGGPCLKISQRAGDYREIFSHFAGYFGTGGYTCKPNTKYTLAGWVKLVGTGTMQYGARLEILGCDSGGGNQWSYQTDDIITDTGGWVYVEKTFTSPNNAAIYCHSGAVLYNHGSSTFTGSVYFDEFTITEVIDASQYTHLRTWTKIGLGDFPKITAASVRAYTTPTDYFEWTNPVMVEDCWNYDSFEFSSATKVGTPLQNTIGSVELIWTTNASIPQGGILIDQLSITAGGFTIRSVMRGTTKYADARAQYKKPTVLMEDLAKLQKLYWYIDYEKDIHFFERETYTCPMEILDSGLVYDDLSVSSDTTQLRNRQVVRGGEAIDGSLYTQDEVTDGKMESWRLDYKPKNLEIWISTNGGVSWSQKTVGVKNLHAATDYDYLFDFNEKVVERASDGILADGVVFRRKYYPYRPIRVQVESAASITKTKALLGGDGIYDGPVINDSSIRSFEDARARAKAELEMYANAVITASWVSQQDGWHAGQIVHIQDSNRSMDDSFVIQKVDRQQKTDGVWQYSVTAGTSMFGLTEFFQLLLRRSEKMVIDVSELVDVVKTIDEEIIATDAWIFEKKTRPWYAHSYTGQYNISLAGTEGGTSNDAYADYCEAA